MDLKNPSADPRCYDALSLNFNKKILEHQIRYKIVPLVVK